MKNYVKCGIIKDDSKENILIREVITMTTNYREMVLNKGYSEVEYLLRIHNVDQQNSGFKALVSAIMAYLQDSNLELEQLLEIGFQNSVERVPNKKICFLQMKECVQDVYTFESKEVEDDDIVIKFIKRISAEIRMRDSIRMRLLSSDVKLGEKQISEIIKIAIRRLMKPEDTFGEILNHVAGVEGFIEVQDLIFDIYPIISSVDIKQIIEDETKDIYSPKERAFKKRELLEPYCQEIEDLINDLNKNYLNLQF